MATSAPTTNLLPAEETKTVLRVVGSTCYVHELEMFPGDKMALPAGAATFSPFAWASIKGFMQQANPALTTDAQQEAAVFAAIVNGLPGVTQVEDRRLPL